MNEESLRDLSDYLDQHLAGPDDCDDTLLHTTAWLKRSDLDIRACLAWLENEGGYCDCEVMVNVITPRFLPGSDSSSFI
jgi:hypothetical protein